MTSSVITNASPSLRRLAHVLAMVAVFYTFVCTFPGEYKPLTPGLDGSWMFALNQLAESSNFLFGRDVAFTYGPWGFLLTPREVGTGIGLTAAAACWALLQLSLFALVSWRLRGRPATLLAFCGGYLVLAALGLWPEHRFLFITACFALSSLQESRRAWTFSAAAALLAIVGLQMKSSLGFACLSVVAGSWFVLVGNRRGNYRTTLGSAVIALLLSLLAVVPIIFKSPGNFSRWMRSSWEIAAGYSSAMSLEGALIPLLLAAACAVCLIYLHSLLTNPLRLCLWLFPGVFFLAFKEGFVRQDGHRMAYFSVASMIPVPLLLAAGFSKRDRWCLSSAFLFLSGTAVVYASNYDAFPALRAAEVASFILMQPGLQNLEKLVHLDSARKGLRAASAVNLRSSVLPAAWQKRLDDPNATVSILPSELSIAAANHLQWQPAPTLQLYVVNARSLDKETSAWLDDRGAKYLIVTYEDIDGRNPILDAPLTWRSMREHYAVGEIDPDGHRVLLVRKPPEHELNHELLHGNAPMNDWIPVRETTHLTYAALNIRTSLFGKLAGFLYHVPELYIEMNRRSGRTERYRLMWGTAASGVLVNYLPGNQYEMEEFFRGRAEDPVTRFRLVPPASFPYFQEGFSWRLLESSHTALSTGPAPQPLEPPEITAAGGEGHKAIVQITTHAPNGVQDLRLVQLLINREINGVKACYVSYEVADRRLWLIADAGSGPAGFGSPGEHTTLSNSQCSIALSDVAVRVDEKVLTLLIPVEFAPAFKGPQHLYAYVMDRRGAHTEWQARAIWQAK